MQLVYNIKDKPKFGQLIVFAFQQLLAILAATIAVPSIVGNGMSQSAALFGAGVGTIVYLLFTKFRSPVFLGSSFAFLGSMFAAFAGAASAEAGYAGIILGAVFAGLVYVVIALVIKFAGVAWIDKLMPAVVIGPTVAIIGLSLAGNAVGDLTLGKVMTEVPTQEIVGGVIVEGTSLVSAASPYVALICGLVTLFVVMICSVFGKKMAKLIPFIIGILAGYAAAAIFTVIGIKTNNTALQVIDFSVFSNMKLFAIPDFSFLMAAKGGNRGACGAYCRPQEPFLGYRSGPSERSRTPQNTARRRRRLYRGRTFRRLSEHHIRRIRWLCRDYGQCFRRYDSCNRCDGYRHFVLRTVCHLPFDDSELRYGRCLRYALRLYCRVGS